MAPAVRAAYPTMRYSNRMLVASVLALVAMLELAVPARAKMSKWKDVQGASFRGEPTEILGPFALFRTSDGVGRRIPLRQFSPEDCRLIQAEIARHKPRGASLAAATGSATMELAGHVLRVERKSLVPADLSGQPEPDLLLVLGGSYNGSEGWFMAQNMVALYGRVGRVYPGLMEAVFLGARHNAAEHREIAIGTSMPWLVSDFSEQGSMPSFTRFLPGEADSNAVLMSREGVPLVTAHAGDAAAVRAFFDQVCELLGRLDPGDPAGWPHRLHYLNATRPAQFAQSRAEPVLVGNSLRPEVLRKYGVKRVAARLSIAADGKVTPTLLSGPEDVPAALAAPMSAALAQAVVAPAIDQGQPVAGSLDYLLEVPAPNPSLEADRGWIAASTWPVLTIPEWLVLRPIVVPEKDFSSTINSDWFADAGADSVRPKEGERQRIDDQIALTWEKVRSADGLVQMHGALRKNYTVGYAWVEFESPVETDAWLGLGSDDGIKIWLNGDLVHDKWFWRASRVDDDVVPLHLRKGANRILIKSRNASDEWNFPCRLRLPPQRGRN